MKNVLFVGLGSIGQRHLRNLNSLKKNINYFAYRRLNNSPTLDNNNKIKKESLKKKYNLTYINSLKKINQFNIDTAFICSPSSFHIEEAITLGRQNVNLFIEKPLGSSLKNITKLENIIKKKKIISMMGYQLKFCPIINKIKKIVGSNKYGNPLYVSVHHGEHIKNFHKYEKYNTFYASKKNLGGGVVLTQIHEIDYLIYIFNKYKIKQTKSLTEKVSNLKINVEDTIAASILFENKKKKFLCNLSMNFYELIRRREIYVIFEKATLKADLINQTIEIKSEKTSNIKKFKYQRNDLFIKELKFFINKIKNKKIIDNRYNIFNGIKTLKIALTIKN